MTELGDSLWLSTSLAPLEPFLSRSELTDIWINRPSEVWVEGIGGAIERVYVRDLAAESLLRMVRQVAALSAQGISRAHPILSATLPGGERFQAIIPPATRGHVAIAIRKYAVQDLRLEDYDGVTLQPMAVRQQQVLAVGDSRFDHRTLTALLRSAVIEKRNILISGGTSSGKTTFLNALLAEVPQNERLIFIEDTPEIRIAQDNAVGLIASRGRLGEAEVTAEDLLIASLRMRPDRIILGEIRGAEASTYLRAINTGHRGSFSTIHADSPERAIDQLALLIVQSGVRMAWDDVVTYVKKSIDIIVQLSRSNGRRIIDQVMIRVGDSQFEMVDSGRLDSQA